MDLSEIEKLGSPAKTLKLSEAIRIGATFKPQCFGAYYKDGGSCAIGAAADAMGLIAELLHQQLQDIDYLYSTKYKRTIAQDNDSGMTREEIADRLERRGQ